MTQYLLVHCTASGISRSRKCASDLDIDLPDNTDDQTYLGQLSELIDHQLPLDEVDMVFYLAGADPFCGDRFGRLALTKEGLSRRDQQVIDACRRQHNVPLTIVMAGGYAPDVADIVDIHTTTVRLAARK